MLNDILKKINTPDVNYTPSEAEYETLFSFIASESELTSKIYKSYEFIQKKFIHTPRIINQMEEMIKKKFEEIIMTKNINLRDYTMNTLIGMFFKLEENYSLFLEIYYENIQKAGFTIEDHNKKYDDNFYLDYLKGNKASQIIENLKVILYTYENIDKKAFVPANNHKLSLIMSKLYATYNDQLIQSLLIMMCYKIKSNMTKFEIEQEKFFFRICYSEYKNTIDFFAIAKYAFEPSENIANRKIFLFALLILFNSIGQNNFNRLLMKINDNPTPYIDYFQKCDMGIMSDHIAHIYTYLDTSRTFQHCFECIIGDLTTCEDTITNEASVKPLSILTNLMNCLERITLEYKLRNYPTDAIYTTYFDIQLLVIKFFNPYGNTNVKEKDKMNTTFKESIVSLSVFNQQLKEYETKYPLIASFIDSINVSNCRNTSLIYQNWLTLIYKNFSLFDVYKIIRKFLFETCEDQGSFNLIKLPTELNKYNITIWKIILDSVIVDTYSLNSAEMLNLITNLKMLFYHELSRTYPNQNTTFDCITYDYSAIVSFFKTKFDTLAALFFSNENSQDDNNQMVIETDIDLAYDNFMLNNGQDIADQKMMIDTQIMPSKSKINKDDTSIVSKTKNEILNIYSIIISSYKANDHLSPKLSKFTLDIADILIKNEESTIVINHISKVISLIIKLDVANISSTIHPVHIIFSDLIKHIIIKTLKNDSIALAEKYYEFLLEIIRQLNTKESLNTVKQGIIYIIKQMIYKNVDSQNYRNPLLVKNMTGLNDIDEKIVDKRFIIELLSLLSKEEHTMFYGFYIRFLSYGVKQVNIKKYNTNITKALKLLVEIDWLPKTYLKLINVLSDDSFVNKSKFITHCISYLNDISQVNKSDTKMNIDNNDKRSQFQVQFRNLLFENINVVLTNRE